MPERRLIINADDCNLTPGVTRGILKSHDDGILTSTTLMINLPLEDRTIRELGKRSRLGVGLHLNITFDRPVSRLERIPSLLKAGEIFKRPSDYAKRLPAVSEVVHEYNAQIRLFKKRFGKLPDHLDTHHHLHDHPLFFQALARVARKWQLPVRRSRLFQIKGYAHEMRGTHGSAPVRTTDFLFGNLEADYHWEKNSFLAVAENLPVGTSEIGCHPAFCDAQLRQASSFREGREEELNVFADRRLRRFLSEIGVRLIRFSDL